MKTGNTVPMLDDLRDSRSRGLGELVVSREGKTARLPLKAFRVSAKAADRVAEVTVRQVFSNPLTEPLEAVYTFPLGGGAVRSFELRVAGKTIVGRIEERGKARERYQKALEEGKRAALLEQERGDVFTMQVGNLPPGEEAEVVLVYSEALPYYEDGTAELRLPLVVAPRYIAGKPLDREQTGTGVEWDTDKVPDASRISPPRLAPGFDPKVALSIEVELPEGNLSDLSCSQHAVKLSGGKVALARQDELMDRDFVLRWRLASDTLRPSLRAAKSGYAMLTLVPPRREGFAGLPRDVVFLLDRSGSMGGEKMASAARACASLLATLGPEDRFAICAFDDQTEWFGRELAAADEASLARGNAFLRSLSARGGTELEPGLEAGLDALAKRGDTPRAGVVVIITDGEVGDESHIMAVLQKKLGDARVFTVGVDTAVNETFLKRLAALGGGTSAFCVPGTALDEALRGISREIGEPMVCDLAFEGADDIAPEGLKDLFAGRAATVFLKAKGQVRVRGRFQDGKPFDVTVKPERVDLDAVEHLWARARITDLEDRFRMGEKVQKAMVRLSLEHSVLCRFTAFIAVDKRETNLKPEERRLLVQPVHLPARWEPAAAPMPSPMMMRMPSPAAGASMFSLSAGSLTDRSGFDEAAAPPLASARVGRIVPGDGAAPKSRKQGIPQAERDAVAKLVSALVAAVEAAWKAVGKGKLPDAAPIEACRKALLAGLAGSELGSLSPELQRVLRRGLLELVAALRAKGANAASLKPMLERCRDDLGTALKPGEKLRFWEESI